jgi:hypothetical protein
MTADLAAQIRAVLLTADGTHLYLSTSCLHDDHNHCRCDHAITGNPKTAATCKFCPAACVCSCHQPAGPQPPREVTP